MQKSWKLPIYSYSKISNSWIHQKKIKTKLDFDFSNQKLKKFNERQENFKLKLRMKILHILKNKKTD